MSNRSDLRLKREDYPLPSTPEGVKVLIANILEAPGAIERIVIENKLPVRVYRWVEPDPMQDDELDLDGAIRNSRMKEYVAPQGASPGAVAWDMMCVLKRELLYPVCWATGPDSEHVLAKWAGFEPWEIVRGVQTILGYQVERISDLPEETLILCAAPFKDADVKDITLTVKTVIEGESHGDSSRQVDDQVRNRSGERSSTTGEVEVPDRGGTREGWQPGGFIRGGVGKR